MSSTDCSEHGYLLFNILNDNTDSCFTNNWISTQNGAVDRDRTCDIKFGKLALYQLRYYRKNGGPGRIRTNDLCVINTLL